MKYAMFTRMQGFSTEGAAGIVKDTLFAFCYWPKLDRPTRIFAPGSSGIKVMGRTPRNVWFPDDVEFLDYYPDALYPAEQAVLKAFPFGRRVLVNMSPVEADVWWKAYNDAVATFPPTHAIHPTTRTTNFLRHKEIKSERTVILQQDTETAPGVILPKGTEIIKRDYEEFIALLTPQECLDLMGGKVDEAALLASKTFVCCTDQTKTLETWIAEKSAPVEVGAVK